MHTINFSTNPNGKLWSDTFGIIELADYEKYKPGSLVEVWLGKYCLGSAEVVGYKDFCFSRITDTLAMMNCGRGAAHQAKLLKGAYPHLQPDSLVMHIVFKWTKRDMAAQEPLLKDWWQVKLDQYPAADNYTQPTLL